MNAILRNWECLRDIRLDCNHKMLAGRDVEGDELAERSLMSPLAGMKHTYVRLATFIHW